MTKLTNYLGKRILVSLVRDEDAAPRAFTLVAIEDFGLWLEPVESLPKPADAERARWPSNLSKAVLVPFAQMAYIRGDSAASAVVDFTRRAQTSAPGQKTSDRPKREERGQSHGKAGRRNEA
jgi:hypothetical protein